jgi:hypothetical protein
VFYIEAINMIVDDISVLGIENEVLRGKLGKFDVKIVN